MRRFRTSIPALAAAFVLLALACGGTTKVAPTCAQLQTQINACATVSKFLKDNFAATCAPLSEACRACVDGVVCGITEQCDGACGKLGDAGADTGTNNGACGQQPVGATCKKPSGGCESQLCVGTAWSCPAGDVAVGLTPGSCTPDGG